MDTLVGHGFLRSNGNTILSDFTRDTLSPLNALDKAEKGLTVDDIAEVVRRNG